MNLFANLFKTKTIAQAEAPKTLRTYKVYGFTRGGVRVIVEVKAYDRTDARRKALGDKGFKEARAFIGCDERDFTTNLIGIDYVLPA